VVGYTRADEGEYIGTEGTRHLAELFPGPDDPTLAARFEARIAADPGPEPPSDVARSDVGFAAGGDRESLRLHPDDEAMITAVAAVNPRTVVAIVSGSTVMVEPWVAEVPALVQSWYSGMEGGHALADVLLGRTEVAGRLPFSVPTDPDHLPPFDRDADRVTYDLWHGWWKLEHDGNVPRYPFGFGLSYTEFELGAFSIERVRDDVVMRGVVRNVGDRDGTDVVQVYGGLVGRRRRLLGFARVDVRSGSDGPVLIRIPVDRLASRDVHTHTWRLEPGDYELAVARFATDPDARRFTLPIG
jgi:beta-glucosidase